MPTPTLAGRSGLYHTTPQTIVISFSPNGAQYGSLGQRPRKTNQMFCEPQRGERSRAFYCAPLGLRFFVTPGPGALPQALISRPFRAKRRFEILLRWLRPSAQRSYAPVLGRCPRLSYRAPSGLRDASRSCYAGCGRRRSEVRSRCGILGRSCVEQRAGRGGLSAPLRYDNGKMSRHFLEARGIP
jgi:hypothetical protein